MARDDEDDNLDCEETESDKMGASGNLAPRLTQLRQRKLELEERLQRHTEELKQLCIKEANLTGSIPIEYPLEPGETPPILRRKVGTSFQLSLQNNNNNNEEEISALELEIHVQTKIAEAALGLVNEINGSKTVKRTRMAEYQQHKRRLHALEEKLLKARSQLAMSKPQQQQQQVKLVKQLDSVQQQSKQKKKPRHPYEEDDSGQSSTMTATMQHMRQLNVNSNTFDRQSDNSGSMRSNHQAVRYSWHHQHHTRRSPTVSSHMGQMPAMAFRPYTMTRQIQPHQRYEPELEPVGYLSSPPPPPMMSSPATLSLSSGLGGYWKYSDNGDLFWWCNSTTPDSQTDRSLDRRKNKRIAKPAPVPAAVASSTLTLSPHDHSRVVMPIQDHRFQQQHQMQQQLVRTQSLGSVGASVPDDDTLGANNNSTATRRSKRTEWHETMLDGPPTPTSASRCQSAVPSIAPEDKYTAVDYGTSSSYEIPAESNPSSPSAASMHPDVFSGSSASVRSSCNGNVVQPYREETKPFEMSDFYKYSTKFKKQSGAPGTGVRTLPPPSSPSSQQPHLDLRNTAETSNAWYRKVEQAQSDNGNATLV